MEHQNNDDSGSQESDKEQNAQECADSIDQNGQDSVDDSVNSTSNSETITYSTNSTSSSNSKELKGLLKKIPTDKCNGKENGKDKKKKVTFSDTMMVFCDDWPDNQTPQIITLKSPTDFNLVEVQGYMFEPPIEYRDFMEFDPPPDYRDFLASSLNMSVFDTLSINYIDDDNEIVREDEQHIIDRFNEKLSNNLVVDTSNITNDPNTAKWQNMILNDNENIEEEQIIGLLKEDAILQAIGMASRMEVILPEEQLCPDDFPIHFQNKDKLMKSSKDNKNKVGDEELSDITSDEGNESSPNGSLQDIASDSSITSQDTIILINNNNDTDSSSTPGLTLTSTSKMT